mmetsp:Transcript_82791/g.146070  ORF Transcript_82791/g.146070 Transcript_82791/m.146070 type:complete len:320 (-) Transcript_82791:316-1275(-)
MAPAVACLTLVVLALISTAGSQVTAMTSATHAHAEAPHGLRVAVAGATGAIGRHLLRMLAEEGTVASITGLVRDPVRAMEDQREGWITSSSKVHLHKVSAEDWTGLVKEMETPEAAYQVYDVAKDPAPSAATPPSTTVHDSLSNVDVVFTAMGTSRALPEVKRDMQGLGPAQGFEKWLANVDFQQNVALAMAAKRAGVRLFVRISASNNNPDTTYNPENIFSLYPRYQGLADHAIAELGFEYGAIILKPGRLERGEDLRKLREWEQQKYEQMGPGLEVSKVAQAALEHALAALWRTDGDRGTVWVEEAEIRGAGTSEDL